MTNSRKIGDEPQSSFLQFGAIAPMITNNMATGTRNTCSRVFVSQILISWVMHTSLLSGCQNINISLLRTSAG